MTKALKISPDWDEVAGMYTGDILGFKELGPISGGITRGEFETIVGERLGRLNPPQRDFVIEWPDQAHEFHLAA